MTLATVGTVAAIASAGVGVYGALSGGKGGSGGANTGSTQKEIDPRLQDYIYGPNGKGGLLGDTSAIYNAGKGGLNQQMVDGLNRQYGVYSDPGNAAGYQNMARMGQSLMSNGVAGNPFTQGGPGAGLLSNIKGLQSQGMPGMGMGMPNGGGMGMPSGGYGGGMGGMGGMLNPPPGAPAAHPGNTPPPSMQGGPFKLPDAATFTATPIPKPDPSTGTDTGYTGAYDGRPITTEMLNGNSAPVWDGKGSFQDWNRKYNQWILENEGSRGGS